MPEAVCGNPVGVKACTREDGTLPALPPDSRGRPCAIAASLQVVAEKWALPAIREIGFGNRRCAAIARNVGAPRDVLAVRLRHPESAGVLVRLPYSEHPPRFGRSSRRLSSGPPNPGPRGAGVGPSLAWPVRAA